MVGGTNKEKGSGTSKDGGKYEQRQVYAQGYVGGTNTNTDTKTYTHTKAGGAAGTQVVLQTQVVRTQVVGDTSTRRQGIQSRYEDRCETRNTKHKCKL